MAKTIIFCADGTWNGPAEPDHDDPSAPATNVFKLFANLAGKDEVGTLVLAKEQERTATDQNGDVLQVAKYLDGVGDSSNFLTKLLGGTTGAGLIVRIVRGYTFISRSYVPGDRIFIVGFSRGAYTARALAGLIASKGLLDASQIDLTDKTNAYRLGSAVWYERLREVRGGNANLLGRLQELALDLPNFVSRPPPASQRIEAPIEAVAVWDTVGALGIPEFTVQLTRVDAFQFADTKLSPKVKHGFHAVAVDEQRADFTPTLWDADSRIHQVLFPGAHADVGGGYATANGESGLSDCSLAWMTEKLESLGVQFASTPTFRPTPSPIGPAHQPWTSAPWTVLPRALRVIPNGLSVSQCLVDRRRAAAVCAAPNLAPLAYAPENLTAYLVGTGLAEGVLVA